MWKTSHFGFTHLVASISETPSFFLFNYHMLIVEILQEVSWVKNAQNIHSFDRICPFISLLSSFLVEKWNFISKSKKGKKDFLQTWKRNQSIGKRLEGWRRALFSSGSSYTLVQLVLRIIPIYHLFLYRVLVGLANKIERRWGLFMGRLKRR